MYEVLKHSSRNYCSAHQIFCFLFLSNFLCLLIGRTVAKALDFLYENNYGFKPLVAEIDNIVTLSH